MRTSRRQETSIIWLDSRKEWGSSKIRQKKNHKARKGKKRQEKRCIWDELYLTNTFSLRSWGVLLMATWWFCPGQGFVTTTVSSCSNTNIPATCCGHNLHTSAFTNVKKYPRENSHVSVFVVFTAAVDRKKWRKWNVKSEFLVLSVLCCIAFTSQRRSEIWAVHFALLFIWRSSDITWYYMLYPWIILSPTKFHDESWPAIHKWLDKCSCVHTHKSKQALCRCVSINWLSKS